MDFIDNFVIQGWAVQFLVTLFLAGGLMTLAVGVGLIVGSAGTLRFFVAVNRWVSTRSIIGPVEDSRVAGRPVQKFRRWVAVAFIAGASFALYGLATAIDAQEVSRALGLDTRPSSTASWLAESAKWVLIVGNLAAVVAGTILGFFPGALAALEVGGARRYAFRRLVKGADTMNQSLDNWVAASPRAAGWVIAIAGLVLLGNLGIVLFGVR